MADSDSFINEVTEEVRRDRLYGLMRRWGWVPALAIVGIVGGAAWFELQRGQNEEAARAFGDALLTGLDLPTAEARVAALDEIAPATPRAEMILALLESGELAGSDDPEAAAATLRAAAETPGIARRYRDLALLRAEMLAPSEATQARLILETLAEPGAPYAALAQEQLALLALRDGDLETALALFRGIEAGAATTPGLQQRASQLIVALEAGSTLIDVTPTPAPTAQDVAPALQAPVPSQDEETGPASAPVADEADADDQDDPASE